jgi:hypothetical protein
VYLQQPPEFVVRLSTGERGQKLLPTVVATKVDRLSIALNVESGCFVHDHAADGSLVTDFDSFMVMYLILLLLLSFDSDFSGVWKTRGWAVASRRGQVAPLTPARDEHRYACPVSTIFITELFHYFSLLTSRQQEIGENDDGEKRDRKDGGPMNNALAEKRDEKPGVLGVPHQPVEAIRDEPVFLAGAMKFASSLHEYSESGEQNHVPEDH